MNWLWLLTGGRPMRKIRFLFSDMITGRPVYLYLDKFGRQWIAESAWALFRFRRDFS